MLMMYQLFFKTALLSLVLLTSCNRGMKPDSSSTQTTAPMPALINQEITSHEGEPILVGLINRQGLMADHYRTWFEPNYQAYKVDSTILMPYRQQLRGMEILLFMGTWCEDSQAQVPQFFRILDWAGFDEKRLKVVSLDNHPDRYKKSPQGEQEGWFIESVPTFILLKNGQEVGRIVEYPVNSLEKDVASMLAGMGRE